MKKSIVSLALIGGLTVTGLGVHQADAASASSVVSLAQQGMGSTYSWGQNDCSGFTMRVFSRLGIQLPHSSAAQAGYGTAVNRSDLQPGDLVFFNTSGSGISHVGIYVGNNRMISAETEKTGVRETQIFGGGASSYWEPRFVTARRITTNTQQTAQSQKSTQESAVSQSSSTTQNSSNGQTQTGASTDQSSTTDQTNATESSQSSATDRINKVQSNQPSTADQTKSTQSDDQASANNSQTSQATAPKTDDSSSVSNETSSSPTINNGVYIVQTGDTLWAISNRSGISVQKIQQINKLEDTLLYPGQKINLQDPSEQYTIKSGDSLWSIAKKHGTTVEQLMKTNNLSSDLIYPDDKLTISDN
ncbi:LysM peptidoglycan-binding domain-containing protein [Sporolactobacillus shoreicorticis]|uniref:LysM peptidoglycan-binding domain-containing protein n=1 Tax=Sporolactobacillus shoreicorticis TaxID=1923877 RepID=A0ABW5S171_9BACL|nr:LysM peptidoglycan-binding domain-containing protein [Sporolactobacillus shoreicorticis]MCO7125395.1 LysM peptidoglycan-binding domain-containing protein [Sporolactobacillus shoreicorticis]